MKSPLNSLVEHLALRVRQVQRNLGREENGPARAEDRLGELLDSMGLVEFLALVASDLGTTVEALEQAAHFRFGTIGELAGALAAAEIQPPAAGLNQAIDPFPLSAATVMAQSSRLGWLTATRVRLPGHVQLASEINAALSRPAGWLESRAGIEQRGLWREQDPLEAAAAAGRECLEHAGLPAEKVGLLLATSEAPPLLAGLAAALHHRLNLRTNATALEVGGACNGFLAALWLAGQTLPQVGTALVIAVEAPTRYLALEPGPEGEAAALFGDGAAACLLCDQPGAGDSIPVQRIALQSDGRRGGLIQLEQAPGGKWKLHLKGRPLALQAVRVMAQAVREIIQDRGLALVDLRAVVSHGGNGRMPGMLARDLGLPPEKFWSKTPRAGNLGSASLPAAWVAGPVREPGPVVWTAAGAGLTWGAMLLGVK